MREVCRREGNRHLGTPERDASAIWGRPTRTTGPQ